MPPAPLRFSIHVATPSTPPRVSFDGFLGMLGVPVLKADCRSLVHRRPPRSHLRRTIFSTPEYPGLIELFSPHFMPLPFSASTSPRLIDFFYPIRRSAYIFATRPSHSCHVHTLISPTTPPLQSVRLFLTPPAHHVLSTYSENPTRLMFSHARKSSGTSPSLPLQPYLSTPTLNPNNAAFQ